MSSSQPLHLMDLTIAVGSRSYAAALRVYTMSLARTLISSKARVKHITLLLERIKNSYTAIVAGFRKFMSFYRDYIYAHLVNILGDPPPIQKIRQQIIPLAQGKVLEIGTGSGANFVHYDPTRVSKLYALEPNRKMIRLSKRQAQRTKLDIEYLDLPGEQIPLGNETVDTVVSTSTLCTIPGIAEAIRGIRRVLSPDGRLIFFELGLSPDLTVQSWQKRLERVHHWVFQGLYLTRDIPSLIVQGGFQITQIEAGYLARFPKSSSYCWWGIASPNSQNEVSHR